MNDKSHWSEFSSSSVSVMRDADVALLSNEPFRGSSAIESTMRRENAIFIDEKGLTRTINNVQFRPAQAERTNQRGRDFLSAYTYISSPSVPVVYVYDRSDRLTADFLWRSFGSVQHSRPTSNRTEKTRIDADATVDHREGSIIHERQVMNRTSLKDLLESRRRTSRGNVRDQ
jgi:hypothetical protein